MKPFIITNLLSVTSDYRSLEIMKALRPLVVQWLTLCLIHCREPQVPCLVRTKIHMPGSAVKNRKIIIVTKYKVWTSCSGSEKQQDCASLSENQWYRVNSHFCLLHSTQSKNKKTIKKLGSMRKWIHPIHLLIFYYNRSSITNKFSITSSILIMNFYFAM